MTGPVEERLRTERLTKRYGTPPRERVVVADVDLSIPAGELWVFSGPSGSGKTTLFGLLSGMITPTSGEIYLAGRSITHLRDHHRALVRRHLVSMVFQEHALVTGMTLEENVFLPLVPQGGPTEEHRGRVATLLERFSLASLADTKIDRLSAGERQRVAIIRALVMDAPLILLDEPTACLDTENVRTMLETLLVLRDEGRTILITTHDQRLTEHPAVDRVERLVDGALVEGARTVRTRS